MFVLPEDDANRQIANGFMTHHALRGNRIRILEPAGGWAKIRDSFSSEHNDALRRYPQRMMVLLVDFDGQGDARLNEVKSQVDPDVAERVFVLGAQEEPEKLRAALGSYETIGKALARECGDGSDTMWSHASLEHNRAELERALARVRPILFA